MKFMTRLHFSCLQQYFITTYKIKTQNLVITQNLRVLNYNASKHGEGMGIIF